MNNPRVTLVDPLPTLPLADNAVVRWRDCDGDRYIEVTVVDGELVISNFGGQLKIIPEEDGYTLFPPGRIRVDFKEEIESS